MEKIEVIRRSHSPPKISVPVFKYAPREKQEFYIKRQIPGISFRPPRFSNRTRKMIHVARNRTLNGEISKDKWLQNERILASVNRSNSPKAGRDWRWEEAKTVMF